ncbi:MAG: CapA family protein [Bacteroidales bacterium]|nr:CapA family protein [Bacteroidales bacterium]
MKKSHCLFLIPTIILLLFSHSAPLHAQDAASWIRKLYAPKTDTISLIFLGDIMMHGSQLISAKTENGYNYLHCFEPIAPRLKGASLSMANIETTFAGPPYTGYPIFSSPDILVDHLKESGFGLLFTANNHICDLGKKGLERSLNLFDSIGVLHTGTFRSLEERNQRYPLLVNLNGIRIAILNYSYGTNGFTVPSPFIVNLIDTTLIAADILRAQRRVPDFIIAYMHWGQEYQLRPNARQEILTNFMIDKGVDIVIGAHPHVPQGMEVRHHAHGEIKNVIVYSLGNVISNQPFPHTQIGLLAEIKLIKNGLYKAITSFDWEWIVTEPRREPGGRKFYVLPLDQSTQSSASITIQPDGTPLPSVRVRTDTLSGKTIRYTLY